MSRISHCVWIVALLFFAGELAFAENEKAPVVLGGIFSLSGFGASYGQAEANGSILAVEEINKKGGVHGRKLELRIEDNQTSVKMTATALQKLLSADDVTALVGPNWAEFSEVVAPVVQRRSIPMLTASGWTQSLTRGRPYVFTTLPSHDDIVSPLAERIEKDGIRSIALVLNGNAYLQSIADALTRQLSSRGIQVSQRAAFEPGTHDYRSFVSRLKAEKEVAVAMVLLQTGENASFVRQVQELGFQGRLYASNNFLEDKAIVSDLSKAEGVIAFEFRYFQDLEREFHTRYKERFGFAPDRAAPRAYDNIFLLVEAMEKCGLKSSALRDCLQETDHRGVTGRIRFDEERNVRDTSGMVVLVQINQGAVKELS